MSIIKKREKGFTLIELLVSIALFSIVVVIMMGAIMTIVDSNKKARSLMTVMNNLNFSVDSMTRSFKTGSNPGETSGNKCFHTYEIDYDATTSTALVDTRYVEYCIVERDGIGVIEKNGDPVTSPDIDISVTESEFIISSPNNVQPLLRVKLKGIVQVTPTINSEFTIQTAVSQRKLEI